MSRRGFTITQTAVMLAAISVFSKLLGFARELLLAGFYGAGSITDAYVMADSIPTTILASVISAAATAYMPVFSSKMETEGEACANRFTSSLINLLWIAAGAALLAGSLFPAGIVSLFAPGFDAQTSSMTVFYLRFSFLGTLFAVSGYIHSAYLEYRNVFISQQMLSFLQNIAIIAFIIISAKLGVPRLLILGITTGRLAVSFGRFVLASKNGYRHSLSIDLSGDVGEVARLSVPVFLGTFTTQINVFIDKILASGLESGTVSVLTYGSNLVTTLSTFYCAIFLTIMYPKLSKAFAQKDQARGEKICQDTFRLIFLAAVPFCMGSLLYSRPLISLVYERGSFDSAAAEMVSSAFFLYALAMVFSAERALLVDVLLALHDAVVPVAGSFVSVLCNVTLNLLLIGPMGFRGLALATAVSQILSAAVLFVLFARKYPDIKIVKDVSGMLKVLALSALSVGASLAVYRCALRALPGAAALALAVLFAIMIYFVIASAMKFDELKILKELSGRS